MGLPVEILAESEEFLNNADGIYQDNVQAVCVFSSMLTQWRVGPGGAVGLDYGVLPVVFGIKGVKGEDQEDAFDSIGVMERAALKHFRSE